MLGLGATTAVFTDLALRHAMETEDGRVLRSEGQKILHLLESQGPLNPSAPESPQVDWWLFDLNGRRIAGSAGATYLTSVPWDAVGSSPSTFQVEHRLYSALVMRTSRGALWVAMDRTPEIQVVNHLRRDLAMLVFAITLLAGILGHLIAKRGLRPLRKIRDETARIEAQGLHHRLDAANFPAELADLVAALNGALGRLEAAFARLEAFSSDLAHELRTPLQNLRSELEGRVLRPPKDANLPEILGSLLEELDRLDGMVEQMLFLARGAAPGSAVVPQPLSAPALLQKAVEFFGPQAEDAGISLTIQSTPDCLIHADPRLLHRAVVNLISNALRHTPAGGRVVLSTIQEDRRTRLLVTDTGEGIPSDLISRLGDRFLRVDEGRARATGGAGLGLAIVKGIMELHRGTFQVESRVGQGTTVTLGFPDPA